MKKIRILHLLTILSLLVCPLATLAADGDFVTDSTVTIYLSDLDENYTISSGASIEELMVGTSTFTFKIVSGSTITVTNTNRKVMEVTGSISGDTVGGTCGETQNTIEISTTASSHTLTVTPDARVCVIDSGSGTTGSGDSGTSSTPAPSSVIITPSSPAVSINSGAAQSKTRAVTLTLSATNASEMIISENSNFADGNWETYVASKSFTLSEGFGPKTVYVQYRSSTGGISTSVSDEIELVSALPSFATQTMNATMGGNVAVSDNSASVSFPAGAVSMDTSVTITPTETFTAPASTQGAAGNKAFEFKAEVGTATITNFAKNVTLTFKYSDSDIAGLKESTLKVYYWNTSTNKWVLVGGTVDAAANTITATTNHFTLFTVIGDKELGTGDLIKLECTSANKDICSAVYCLAKNGKRYVFPTEKIYYSWYSDFSTVRTVSAEQLASYTIGGNVTYRPGIRMIKINTDPKVYAVEKGGKLRWVKTEAAASAIYGNDWNKMIDDLPDAFFFDYVISADISSGSDYAKTTATSASPDINADKGL
jgi:hypothetical protein